MAGRPPALAKRRRSSRRAAAGPKSTRKSSACSPTPAAFGATPVPVYLDHPVLDGLARHGPRHGRPSGLKGRAARVLFILILLANLWAYALGQGMLACGPKTQAAMHAA